MKCLCGSEIIDQTDKLPYKGAVIRDQEKSDLVQSVVRDISSFINSISHGTREKWIAENYLIYDQDDCLASEVQDAQVIDFILSRQISKELCIYQCLSCGNIMIERAPFSNKFATFTSSDWEPYGASILQSNEQMEGPNFKILS